MNARDYAQIVSAVVLSPIISLTKLNNHNLLEYRDLLLKAYNDGIYHFTSSENADKIMDSASVKASDVIMSYGKKKSFFFAGKPDIESLAMNSIELQKKLTAIKINLSYEELASFNYRKGNDEALSFEGDFEFDKEKAQIVRFGLKNNNGFLFYEQISEEEYKDYDVDLSNSELSGVKSNMIRKLKGFAIGMKREYELLSKSVSEFLKDERTTAYVLNEMNQNIENNMEEFNIPMRM